MGTLAFIKTYLALPVALLSLLGNGMMANGYLSKTSEIQALQAQVQTAQTRTEMARALEEQIASGHLICVQSHGGGESWARIKRERERMQREHKPFRGFGNANQP